MWGKLKQKWRRTPSNSPGLPETICEPAQRDDPSRSEASLRQAIADQPAQAELHLHLGWLLFQNGRRDEGMGHLRQAVALNPGSAETHLQLGIALVTLNNPQEAAQSFRQALNISPDFFAYNNLGVAMQALGQFAEAADCFAKALQIDPDNPTTCAALGGAYARQGRFADAVTQYRKAVALLPDDPQMHFALAAALADDGQLPKAVGHYREAVRLRPGYAEAYCNLGLLLHQLGHKEAGEIMRRAHELAPDNREIAVNLRLQGSGKAPMWHFSMMNDAPRNAAYEAAICRALRPDDRVLDIGSGSGLLSMMAARAGATGIISCEMVPAIAEKARQIIAKNGYGGQVDVLEKCSTSLRIPQDMPEAADLLISEIFSSELLGEDVLTSFEHAWAHLLKPDARIVPAQAWIVGRLAGATALADYLRVGTMAGFDLQAFNEFSPAAVIPAEWNIEMEYYSEPFEIFGFDFQGRRHFPPEKQLIRIPVTNGGLCFGVLQWIRLRLYDDIVYENPPGSNAKADCAGHWRHVLHAFETPVQLQQGQVVTLHASHNRSNLIFFIE